MEGFGVAAAAAKRGWDYPAVRASLECAEADGFQDDPDDDPWYDDELAIACLNVLERQGRSEEYLRLAKSNGLICMYLTMLIRSGSVEQAVAEFLSMPADTKVALAVGQALRAAGYLEEALHVGRHGLTAESHGRVGLAEWVCELARGMDRPETALQAAVIAFQDIPGLSAYKRVEDLAGEAWHVHRPRMVDHLLNGQASSDARVDIFLHENMVDEAIAAVEKHAHYDCVRRVADAVAESHPEWVARAAAKQAESIFSVGQAGRYHHAVDWLHRVKTACLRSGRKDAWDAYISTIRKEHGRKYKLMSMMRIHGLV